MNVRYIIAYIATVFMLVVGTPYFMVLGVIEAWVGAIKEWEKWNNHRRADNGIQKKIP